MSFKDIVFIQCYNFIKKIEADKYLKLQNVVNIFTLIFTVSANIYLDLTKFLTGIIYSQFLTLEIISTNIILKKESLFIPL